MMANEPSDGEAIVLPQWTNTMPEDSNKGGSRHHDRETKACELGKMAEANIAFVPQEARGDFWVSETQAEIF